jgi:hypothetical protein
VDEFSSLLDPFLTESLSQLAGREVGERLSRAKQGANWIAVAQVAFDRTPVHSVDVDAPKGTSHQTSMTANAFLLVNANGVSLFVTAYCT